MNSLINVFTNIRNNSRAGNKEFVQRSHSKFVLKVLEKLVSKKYLTYVEVIPAQVKKRKDSKIKWLKIGISPSLNQCAGILPQFSIKHREIEQNEKIYLPAVHVGILIFSTPLGIITNQEIREQKLTIGGKLLGYVY